MIELFIVEKNIFNVRSLEELKLALGERCLILQSHEEIEAIKFHVNSPHCVVYGASSQFLEAAYASGYPIILFNMDPKSRSLYQRKYNPIYICDSDKEFFEFLNLYRGCVVEDIRKINKDLSMPLVETKSLKPAEQDVLGKTLFPVYQTMMYGRNEKSFISLLKDSRPVFIEVMSYVNKLGKAVGFMIVSGHTINSSAIINSNNTNEQYMVCEVLACMLPEIQNNKYVEDGLLMMLDEYHLKNPEVNIVIFDSAVNYKSYKIALKSRGPRSISTYPHPTLNAPSNAEIFIRYLKNYFGYQSVSDNLYTGRTTSDIYVKEFPINNEDPAWNFYNQQTGNQSNVGLLFLACYYLTGNNSLSFPAQSQFFYDESFGDESSKFLSTSEERRIARVVGNQSRRQTGKMFLLSVIFKHEMNNLTPILTDLPKADLHRTSLLWYSYFSRGIFLSAGGASESFVRKQDLTHNKNLTSFNQYRSDRAGSAAISSEEIAGFLTEEKLLSTRVCLDDITFSFCLGGHEGTTRLARCLYVPKKNTGIFCLVGSYGFLAASMAVMRPAAYKVCLVAVERFEGEKISLKEFVNQIKKHPTFKTLFLELKTTCGAIYTDNEIKQLIEICKNNDIFVVFDAAHINMNYEECNGFPDVVGICQQFNYHNFSVVYTASKSYGLERARIGFVVLSTKSRIPDFWIRMEMDLYRVLGSLGDMPFEIGRILFDSPLAVRWAFLRESAHKLLFNLNLMIAYIEGVDSALVENRFRQLVQNDIPLKYRNGIPGVSLVYKPRGGVQLKATMAALQNKYFANIRMTSAEIFGYVLNKIAGVVILNSYQILDPEGFGMRLGYAIQEDVHKGMRAIHDFVMTLSDQPSFNRFLYGYKTLDEILLEENTRKKQESILNSKLNSGLARHSLFSIYKQNVKKSLPTYVKLSDKELELSVHNAATIIQRKWRMFSQKKYKNKSLQRTVEIPKSKL